ncbi:MAG TPA: sigma-70 family RNA polymerase sigma factor [Thermoleophilaceae bacterium]
MKSTAEQGRSERDTATGRLLRAYRQDGDARARDRLVQLYLSLVETFAQRYARPGVEYDDLVQAGSIGLLNAIERYDARRGDEFAAFAVPTIVGEIKRHIRDRAGTIKLPRRLQEAAARLPRVREELTAQLEREPSDRELADALELKPDELVRLVEALRVPPEATEADAGEGEDELDISDERLTLAGAFHVLDDTERSIVRLRFERDLGPADAAAQLGLSERQLARRTQAALTKLRLELEGGPSAEFQAASGDAATAERDRPTQPQSPPPTAVGAAAPKRARPPHSAAAQRTADSVSADEPSPAPAAKPAHSGRLLLRMPQSLHSELADAAEREEVSLNQFITNSLAAAVGWRQAASDQVPAAPPGEDARDDDTTASVNAQPRWLRAALVTNIVVVALAAIVAVVLLVVAWQQGF